MTTSSAISTTRLRPDATLAQSEWGWSRLECPSGSLELPLATDREISHITSWMAREVGDAPSTVDSPDEQSVSALIGMLDAHGWLFRDVYTDGQVVATLEPHVSVLPQADGMPAVHPSPRLSRFASMTGDCGLVIVASSRTRSRVVLHDSRLAVVVALLAAGQDPATSGLSSDTVERFLDLLGRGCLLADDAEANDQRLAQWSPVDLRFHQQSRRGIGTREFGATFPFRGRFEGPPVLTPVTGSRFSLSRPDFDEIKSQDRSLQESMELRQSTREYDDQKPLTVASLAEFLARVALDRSADSAWGRSYPAAGGLYELRIYPVVRLCAGLSAGIYYYDAAGHDLTRIAPATRAAAHLLAAAKSSMGGHASPQIVLVITAHAGLMTWKYQSIGYSLVLKDVGVMLAHMSLVASAMNLGGCILGAGDSETFAQATGRDPYAEPSVGEFSLGSRRIEAGTTP